MSNDINYIFQLTLNLDVYDAIELHNVLKEASSNSKLIAELRQRVGDKLDELQINWEPL